MRAEHAMALRRVEISAKTFREKAAAQIIEINRNREELKALSEQRRDKSRAVAELEEKVEKLERELRGKEERLRKVTERLESAQKALEKRAAEVAAPPYDVLSTEEARAQAQGRLWSPPVPVGEVERQEVHLPVAVVCAELRPRDDAHAAVRDRRKHALHRADEVARVAHARVALLLLLQDRHRDLGEVVEHQVVRRTTLDLPPRRLQPVAPEALPACNAYRLLAHSSSLRPAGRWKGPRCGPGGTWSTPQ